MVKGKLSVGAALLLLCIAAGMLVGCWEMFKPGIVAILPAQIPGAEYVGMETCGTCHKDEIREFPGAPHAAFTLAEDTLTEEVFSGEGCEACHGPGSLHVTSQPRGDKTKIIKGDWKICVQCHMDVKAKFRMRFHHPVPEGRLSCPSCHNPHKGMRAVRWAEKVNETCFKCHPDKKGPWTYPHEAVTEDGCVSCHEPHGTNVDKMLISSVDILCLRCHVQSNHPRIGNRNHAGYLGPPTRGGCHNCHKGIHGSNFSKHLRHE